MRSIGDALKKDFLTKSITRALVVAAAAFSVMALSLALASVSRAAEAPEWSKGFPRLAEKNALLQWNPVKGAAEYKVYRTETEGKNLKLITTVKPNRHLDKDLPPGKSFYYYVTAVVDGKEGPRSAVGRISTPEEKVYVPMSKPTIAGAHVKPAPGGKIFVGIRWEGGKGTDFVSYNLYRSKKKGGGYTLIGSTSTDSFNDEDVKPGETYYYVVTSVDNNFKETGYSNEQAVEIPKPEAPKAKEEVPPTKMRTTKFLFFIPTPGKPGDPAPVRPNNAQDVVVDEAVGHIYVTSYEKRSVLVYDMEGRYQFSIERDGVEGKEPFDAPENLALGRNGLLYVTDFNSSDIYIFDYQGRPQGTIHVDISHVPGYEKAKARIYGIEIDTDGFIYVSEPVTSSIFGYDEKGKRVFEISERQEGKAKFSGPGPIVSDGKGDLAVVDMNRSALFIVGTDGRYKRNISKKGYGAGLLYYPTGVARSNDGELFLASGMSPNIQVFSFTGDFDYALANETCDGPPQVEDMRGIYIDSKNRLYVADGLKGRVVVMQLLDNYCEVTPSEK